MQSIAQRLTQIENRISELIGQHSTRIIARLPDGETKKIQEFPSKNHTEVKILAGADFLEYLKKTP